MSAEGLLKDIIEDPADDAPRLVYADWLEEHGQPERAEFIRVQVELRHMKEGDRRKEFSRREAELLRLHENTWRAELPALQGVKWLDWSRGFVCGVQFNSFSAFRKSAAAAFAAAPIQALLLGGRVSGRGLGVILASPVVASLTYLNVRSGPVVGPEGAVAIANSPYLTRLRALCLQSCYIGSEGAIALAGSPHLRRLHYLELTWNAIEADGAEALANSPVLDNVEILCLGCNRVGGGGAEALAASGHVGKVRTMPLDNNQVGDAGAAALANSKRLKALRELNLLSNGITDIGARALASKSGLPALAELHLGDNLITDDGAIALAESRALKRLKSLSLIDYSNRIGPRGVAALRASFGDRVGVNEPRG